MEKHSPSLQTLLWGEKVLCAFGCIGLQMSLPSQGPACPSYGKEVEGASLRKKKKKKKFETHRRAVKLWCFDRSSVATCKQLNLNCSW